MRVKTEAKRDEIVAVATKVFLESGYERTSMAQIAERVGGSKGTLYSYFPSKGDLFVEVVIHMGKEAFDSAFAMLDPAVADSSDLGALLRRFGETFLATVCQPRFIAARRVVIAEAAESDIGQKFYEVGPKVGDAMISTFLASQMKAGRLREAPPDVATRQLMALLEAETLLLCLMSIPPRLSKPEIKRMVDNAVSTFLAAYAPSDVAPKGARRGA